MLISRNGQDHRSIKEPLRLFESMVVVGLHPNYEMQALHKRYVAKRPENPGKLRNPLIDQQQSHVERNLEPQVLFRYPPEKPLPLKYKDLLSFYFPGGAEVHAVERTPSMSELSEILLGQGHLKQSDPSFVFRLQVKSPTIPQLPKHRELFSSLSPFHAKLVGESYLGRKRPMYESTDVQVSLLLKESFIDKFPVRK